MESIMLKGNNKSLNVKELLENFEIEENDIIIANGSLIEGSINELSAGMGNEYSDIDIYIIREHKLYKEMDAVYVESVRKTIFKMKNGINYDIEIYDKSYIEKILDSLNNTHFSPDTRVLNFLDFPKGWNLEILNEFLNRFKYSICLYNQSEYERLNSNIDYKKFSDIYKIFLLNYMDTLIEDVLGNECVNEYESAYLSLREAFNFFIKYLIVSEGEFIDRDKWIYIKLKNIVQKRKKYESIFETYNKIFFSDVTNLLIMQEVIKETRLIINNSIEDMLFEEEL